MSDRWRIGQLSELVGQALRTVGYGGQESGRVRDLPDVRNIRYYTTLGLLDRPLEMQGRTAFYGPRHVLQIVAIKRLQANGMSLVQVQKALAGIGEAELARIAGLPAGFFSETAASASEPPAEDRPAAPARRKYWAELPQVAAEPAPAPVATARAKPAVILPLAEGVSLVMEGVQPDQLDEARVRLLQPALAQLRDALNRAGITADSDACAAPPRKEKP